MVSHCMEFDCFRHYREYFESVIIWVICGCAIIWTFLFCFLPLSKVSRSMCFCLANIWIRIQRSWLFMPLYKDLGDFSHYLGNIWMHSNIRFWLFLALLDISWTITGRILKYAGLSGKELYVPIYREYWFLTIVENLFGYVLSGLNMPLFEKNVDRYQCRKFCSLQSMSSNIWESVSLFGQHMNVGQ